MNRRPRPNFPQGNGRVRPWGLVAIILVAVMFILMLMPSSSPAKAEISPHQFYTAVENGLVADVVFKNKDEANVEGRGKFTVPQVVARERNGVVSEITVERFFVRLNPLSDADEQYLNEYLGDNWRMAKSGGSSFFSILLSFLPLIILIGFFIFMMRRASGVNGAAMQFGRAKPGIEKPHTRFKDIAGQEEAVIEIAEVVDFLKFPERFRRMGAKIPRGVLLVGPPGTGKTLLARAVAGEANTPFFSTTGSGFVEMFVGVGAGRVRDLFQQARNNSPAIIFIDEIDAVGRQRGTGIGGGHDEREQTLNQILSEMDGFSQDTNVIVIAATNRPDVLDPAILRPGRFDRHIVLDTPDVKARAAILKVHKGDKPFAQDIDLQEIAKQTPGFTGADLANVLNEAALLGARRNKQVIGMSEIREAVERVIAGPERRSRVMSERERLLVSIHEAGHAVVAAHIKGHDPVYKITIVPRGMAAGSTRYMPTEDHRIASKPHFEGFMASALGGRVAEEIILGEVTTGAHDDLEKVTQIARDMVTRWGMSDLLGPRTYGKRQDSPFLGRDIYEQRNYSEYIAQQIDREVREIINRALERARKIIKEHEANVEAIAKALQEKETLEGAELAALLAS